MTYEEYLKIQENGSAWTTKEPYRQFLLKESINWMLMSLQSDPKRLLDLGCGDAWGTEYMRSKLPGSKVVGGDVDKPKISFAQSRGLDVRYMDMHKLEEMWDVIYCSHSLEHSFNIKKALNCILDHLNPEGKLYLIVPLEPEIKSKRDGSHTQVIKKDEDVVKLIKQRKDVVIEFTGHQEREVKELWLIVRKI